MPIRSNAMADCPSVRDHRAIEAALYRPQIGYYADLIEEATALWECLSQNDAFMTATSRPLSLGHILLSPLMAWPDSQRRRDIYIWRVFRSEPIQL